MKLWSFIGFVIIMTVSHVQSSSFHYVKEANRDVANIPNRDDSPKALENIRKKIDLEGVFKLTVGSVRRYRVVEKPELVITFKNLNGDLYAKLSWQADYGFQRVNSEQIQKADNEKLYSNIKLNNRGKYISQVKEMQGVLFYLDEQSKRELELEEIL
jgi:hypothetical protein